MLRTLLQATFLTIALTDPVLAQQELADAKLLATACNQFAADLRGTLASDGNQALSPASIAIALLMLEPGARGETAAELARALHLPAPLHGDRLAQACRSLLHTIGSNTEGKRPRDWPQLRIVNDLWTQTSFAIRTEYTSTLRSGFGASHREVDFRAAPDRARELINDHVADATENRIRELLTPDLVGRATRMVLTNAMWFRGTWQYTFQVENTQAQPFRLASGEAIQVPTMHQTASFRYAESGAWQCLSLPFTHGDIVCEVMLPRPAQSLAQAERDLLLGAHTAQLQPRTVQVQLPRLQVGGSFRLHEALQALGIRAAFTAGKADFRGIRDANDLVVDEVVHRAWLAVDEAGAEAAAATAVLFKSASAAPNDLVHFVADRPFALALRDSKTGLVLFSGRVHDPRAGQPKAATPPPSR
jgi:serpin B